MKRGVVFGFLLFVTGLVIGMVLTGRTRSATEGTATPLVAAASQLAPQVVAATSNLPDFSDVAADTVSSVTNISSLQLVRRTSPFSRDPFFRYFFGDSSDLFGLQQRPSLGSGVIVSPSGETSQVSASSPTILRCSSYLRRLLYTRPTIVPDALSVARHSRWRVSWYSGDRKRNRRSRSFDLPNG